MQKTQQKISNKVVESTLKDYMHSYFIDAGIKDPTTRDKGKAFLDFYVREILANLTNLDEDMISEGLEIDYSGDLGVDFVYKDGKSFYIFQSKFKGSKASVSSDEISGFFDVHSKITDKEYLRDYGNANLQDILKELTPNCEVQYRFVTNAHFSNTLEAHFNKRRGEIEKKPKTANISWEYIEKEGFTNEYRRAQSVKNEIPAQIEIPLQSIKDSGTSNKTRAILNLTSLLDDDNKYETVICPVKGTHIQQIYQEHKESLFAYNIRGFLGMNAVNKKIKETIEREPSIFYYLNNGISAICTDIEVKEVGKVATLVCDDFQIINGAQTVTAIGTHKNPEHLKDLQLLLRVTKSSTTKSHDKGLNKKIIMANNSQTVIKDSDFRSNDDVQTFLVRELKNYPYKHSNPYKKINYIPKRGGKRKGKKNDEYTINMERLAKVLYSFREDPILFQGKPKLLFDADSENGKYWNIFGVDGEEVSFLAPEQVKEIAAIIMLWIYIEDRIKEIKHELISADKKDTYRYQATLANWILVWSFGFALRFIDSETECAYRQILNGKAFKKDEGFVAEWFDPLFELIEDVIGDKYLNVAEPEGGTARLPKSFNFRNWTRQRTTLDVFKIKLERLVGKDKFPKP